jgi:hypothetical protein
MTNASLALESQNNASLALESQNNRDNVLKAYLSSQLEKEVGDSKPVSSSN